MIASIYIQVFLFSIVLNLFFFFIAYRLQTDKLTDFSYSLTFALISIFSLLKSEMNVVDLITGALVIIWSIRLGMYLYKRIKIIGRDDRFDAFRHRFFSFLGFWIVQGITCAIVSIPLIAIHQLDSTEINPYFILAILLSGCGLVIETIADKQKFKFKLENKNAFMQSGLWKYLRHPNYSGELMFWWFLFVAGLTLGSSILSIVGPLWISIILLFFSGIPLLEKKWQARYGQDKAFVEYLNRTNRIIPYIY